MGFIHWLFIRYKILIIFMEYTIFIYQLWDKFNFIDIICRYKIIINGINKRNKINKLYFFIYLRNIII
jgi:hypothetical protein